jgi:hypothetical protein
MQLAISIATLGLMSGILLAAEPADEKAALEKQAAELRQQIARLQKELEIVEERWQKLAPRRALTPAEAVAAFRTKPENPVTVEFGVLPIGERSGPIAVGEDPDPAIIAVWDNYLPGGGTLTAVIPPGVFKKLQLPNKDGTKNPLKLGEERKQVVGHIETNGIRVTGVLRDHGRDRFSITIDDPANVVLYITGSGQ